MQVEGLGRENLGLKTQVTALEEETRQLQAALRRNFSQNISQNKLLRELNATQAEDIRAYQEERKQATGGRTRAMPPRRK